MNTNAFGPIRVSQAFLPLLRKAPEARIITVAMVKSWLSADVPSYCLSKLTLNGALADALQAKRLRFPCVLARTNGCFSPVSEQGADTAIWFASEASPIR